MSLLLDSELASVVGSSRLNFRNFKMNVSTVVPWLRVALSLRHSCHNFARSPRVLVAPFSSSVVHANKKASSRDMHPDLNVPGKKKKETPSSPYITLMDLNNEVTVVSLEAAEKLAAHKSLRLIRESDTSAPGAKKTYRLVHAAEYFKKAQKSKLKTQGLKGEKAVALKSHISTHDLDPKVHQIQQWCRKAYQIKVAIDSLGDMEKAKEVFETISNATKDIGTISQKQETKSGIRFMLKPLLLNEEEPVEQPSS